MARFLSYTESRQFYLTRMPDAEVARLLNLLNDPVYMEALAPGAIPTVLAGKYLYSLLDIEQEISRRADRVLDVLNGKA